MCTKWSEPINAKVLLWTAKDLVRSGDLQRNPNRRKKVYMALIKELWYNSFTTDLNFSTQTLGDQASTIEKSLGREFCKLKYD